MLETNFAPPPVEVVNPVIQAGPDFFEQSTSMDSIEDSPQETIESRPRDYSSLGGAILGEALSNVEERSVQSPRETFLNQTSDLSLNEYKKDLALELEDSEMVHISRLKDRVDDKIAQSHKATTQAEAVKLEADISRMRKNMYRLFGSKVDRYYQINYMLQSMDDNPGSRVVVGSEASSVAEVYLKPENLYESNSGAFIKPEELYDDRESIVIVLDKKQDLIDIPLSSIVSAAGFESWNGRGNQGSKDKIKHYASLETDIPPIQNELYGYILPNGKIMFQTGNSHRVAAAKLKGQKTIGFNGILYLRRLDYNPRRIQKWTR